MSRYRKVSTRMWGDASFRALSAAPPNGQTLWFYLLTGPQTSIVPGAYAATQGGLSDALGWPLEGFLKAFAEVSREGFAEGMPEGCGEHSEKPLARADWKAGFVWVPNAIKHNAPQSPNVILSWRDAWEELPECSMKLESYHSLRAFCEGMGKGFGKAFHQAIAKPSAKPFGKAMANQDQDQEQDQKEKKRPPARSPAKKERAPRERNPAFDAVVSVVDSELAAAFPNAPKSEHNGGVIAKLIKRCGGEAERLRAPLRAFLADGFWRGKGGDLAPFESKFDSWERAASGPANTNGRQLSEAAQAAIAAGTTRNPWD